MQKIEYGDEGSGIDYVEANDSHDKVNIKWFKDKDSNIYNYTIESLATEILKPNHQRKLHEEDIALFNKLITSLKPLENPDGNKIKQIGKRVLEHIIALAKKTCGLKTFINKYISKAGKKITPKH